ncbi:MAG: endospore germination permease [Firmicutes bacterium]|jgi:spore germination protein KB|nr:endospore germination permease [Bacillota bacterium]
MEKIANRQLYFILFMIRCNIAVAFLPVLTTADALQDAWISSMVQFFPAALLLLFFGSLGTRFPDLTVTQYSEMLVGRWTGKALSMVILWIFLHMAAIEARTYANMLITVLLPDTPLVFLIGTMVIASAAAAYAGIEVIGRAADLLFPIYLLMIIGSLLIPLPQLQTMLVNLEPVCARGAGPILRGAITPALFTVQYLVLTILAPSTNEPKRALRTAVWALAGGSAILIPIAIVTVAILGPVRGAQTVFPIFGMVRVITLSEFIDRIEALAVFAWGLGLFVEVAIYLYCGAKGLSQVMGLGNYRPLILPMAVIWTAFGIQVSKNVFQLLEFFKPLFFAPYALIIIIVPFTILWIAYFLRRLSRGRSGAP